MSAFLGLVKYMTIFSLSALRPKAESSSVWIEVTASSMSLSLKTSFTVVLSRYPENTSCFFVVVTCTKLLPTLIATSIFPLDLESRVTGWYIHLVSLTTLMVSFGRCK